MIRQFLIAGGVPSGYFSGHADGFILPNKNLWIDWGLGVSFSGPLIEMIII